MTQQSANSVLDAARCYLARGYMPVPIPAGMKGPVLPGWQRRQLSMPDLPSYFNGTGNIGLLLGDDGGCLVDVDLDCPEANELADQYLPPSPGVTGRPSKPRSHRWYIAQGVGYEKFTDPLTGGTLMELRGAGHQTVVGPSIHPSGEPYDRLEGEPARVDTAVLVAAVKALFDAVVKRRHPEYVPGQTEHAKTTTTGAPGPSFGERTLVTDGDVLARATAYLDRMPKAVDKQGGSDATYAAATVLVHGFGLHPDQALRLLSERYNPRCEPPWSEKELRHKIDAATTRSHTRPYGWLRDAGPQIVPGVDLSQLRVGETRKRAENLLSKPVTVPAPAASEEQPAPAVGDDGDKGGSGGGDDDDEGDEDGEDDEGATPGGGCPRPPTDLGNAERLADRFSESLRYCHSTGRWMVWDGTRWKEDDSGEPHRAAGEVARDIIDEAKRQFSKKMRKALGRWAFKSEERARIEAMVALARSQPSLVVRVEDLDRDRWLFNVQNGTIDLRTGELREHRREDLITKISPVTYDPNATCPLFDGFLGRIFGGDDALMTFVKRLLGMCLTGDVSEQTLPICHGAGANGKSVLLDTVTGLMGEYATVAPPSLLTQSKSNEHPTEIADLRGRRLVVASETEEGATLKLQLVKRLTGDKTLKGRFMRQDYFSFERTHKLVMVTNNRPRVQEDSEAVWRRLRLVPFSVVIPVGERDKTLLDKLCAEWPGILALLVRACLAWQREGLGEPEAVTGATAAYRAAEDALGRFLDERCDVDPRDEREASKLFVPWKFLFDEYTSWSAQSGDVRLDARELQSALDRHGFPSTTQRFMGKPAKGRRGLVLKAESREGQP